MPAFEVVGIAGIAFSIAGYVPQVVHLARERCSAGVSRRAWSMWIASSLLVGSVAVYHRDIVFMLLQLCALAAATVILILARRYRGMACESHARTLARETPQSLAA